MKHIKRDDVYLFDNIYCFKFTFDINFGDEEDKELFEEIKMYLEDHHLFNERNVGRWKNKDKFFYVESMNTATFLKLRFSEKLVAIEQARGPYIM